MGIILILQASVWPAALKDQDKVYALIKKFYSLVHNAAD